MFVPLFMGLDLTEGWSAVVAKDAACARYIAHGVRHLRDLVNGSVFKVRSEWLAKDEPFRGALRRAVAASYPGAITRVGDSAVIIEDRNAGIVGGVFLPLSSAQS